jgi:uncharacterized membrane protein
MSNARSSTGVSPNALAAIAYLAWWVTGAVVLALERDSAYVRFHAWQSVLALGSLFALGLVCFVGAFLALSSSAGGFTAMLWLAAAIWGAGLVVWVLCLIKAWTGKRWKLPVAGAIAERYSQSVGARG